MARAATPAHRPLELSAEDLARIEKEITPSKVAGTRYGEDQMKSLDSDR